MDRVLITGGAGFVGSNLAIYIKRDNPDIRIIALDNLHRRGSEFNVQRLKEKGIDFIHGDIRVIDDLENVGEFVTWIKEMIELNEAKFVTVE